MIISIEKKTDQLNYEDFLHGITRDITIAGVKKGSKEQQYDIAIEGDSRCWRPAVTVLKLLVEAWGDDAKEWVGRRARLYGDPEIMFGRDKVGGIRVSHLSHIDKPVRAMLTETRGKRKLHVVDPLPDERPPARPASPPASPAHLADLTDTFVAKGIPESAWLSGANQVTGGAAGDLVELTVADVDAVLAALADRPDVEASA